VIIDFNIMRRISSERLENGSIEEVLPAGRTPGWGIELSLIFPALEVLRYKLPGRGCFPSFQGSSR
jgi:hypothetical protein